MLAHDQAPQIVRAGTPLTTDGKFDGDVPLRAGTLDITFDEAGTFKYFCTIHNSMTETIVVK